MEGINYLRNLLALKQNRINTRYDFYEMKNIFRDLRVFKKSAIDIPTIVGWCPKAVDSLADRLHFKGWENDNFNLSNIFKVNNQDILFDSAILSALITGCSFIYISEDESGYPRLEVIDGRNATGIIDPVTNLLKEGYAVLERDPKNGHPTLEAYFETGRTTFYPTPGEPYIIENSAPAPLLVPVINRPDSKRPLGHSRLSRAMMSITEAAVRVVRRSEISSEFYSWPQRYLVGTDPDAESIDSVKATMSTMLEITADADGNKPSEISSEFYSWPQRYLVGTDPDAESIDSVKATMSTMLEITADADGNKPTIGQFPQASMTPYTDQIRAFASLFAGETGLTMTDLGFPSDNPASAEAIKASHESLRVLTEKSQRTFGACFLNVGYLAACIRDQFPYQRRQFYLTKAVWYPAFKPDASALSVIGDGAIKINQAVPGYFDESNLEKLTGIEPTAIEEL